MTQGEVFWLFIGLTFGATLISLGFRILILPSLSIVDPDCRACNRPIASPVVRQPAIYSLDPSNHADFPGRNDAT
jgi:hypothetical protein